MTSKVNAATTGIVLSSDNSGILELQASGNTGITLNSARAVGFGASPSYGTSGQAILSGGSAAAPTWGTPATSPAFTGYTTQNGQGITTTLTNTSTIYQVFTGTSLSTSTVQLPVTSTLSVGWTFNIRNDSIVNVLVNSSGSNLLVTITAGTSAMVTCVATGGTTAADWVAGITNFTTYNGTGAVVLRVQPSIRNPNITDGLLLNSLAGTSGQVLTSAGSSNVPTWTTPSSGALVFLSNVTASNSATVDIETTFSSTYTNYLLVVADVSLVTGGGTLQALLKINGTYQTSSYRTFLISGDSSAATVTGTNQDLTAFANVFVNLGQGTRNGGFTMLIQAPSDTTNYKPISFNGAFNNNNGYQTTVIGSIIGLTGTQAMTGIRFQVSSGNIDTGTFRLYGITNS